MDYYSGYVNGGYGVFAFEVIVIVDVLYLHTCDGLILLLVIIALESEIRRAIFEIDYSLQNVLFFTLFSS